MRGRQGSGYPTALSIICSGGLANLEGHVVVKARRRRPIDLYTYLDIFSNEKNQSEYPENNVHPVPIFFFLPAVHPLP
jgi:hypothetical protein